MDDRKHVFYLTDVGFYSPKHLGLHIPAKLPIFMAYIPQTIINNKGETLGPNDVTFSARIGTTPAVPGVERDGDSFEQIHDLLGICRLEEDETLKFP